MGFAMANVFAREGMNLVLADVEKGALREAVARIEALGVEAVGIPTSRKYNYDVDVTHLNIPTGLDALHPRRRCVWRQTTVVVSAVMHTQ